MNGQNEGCKVGMVQFNGAMRVGPNTNASLMRRMLVVAWALGAMFIIQENAAAMEDVATGRWITRDPLWYYRNNIIPQCPETELSSFIQKRLRNRLSGKIDEINDYLHARNCTVNRVDPSGFDSPGCDTWTQEQNQNVPCNKKCELECCSVHDFCYDEYDCTQDSWLGGEGSACSLCNVEVVGCMIGCLFHPSQDDPNVPNYYCGCHNTGFDDSNSPHMGHSTTDAGCVSDG